MTKKPHGPNPSCSTRPLPALDTVDLSMTTMPEPEIIERERELEAQRMREEDIKVRKVAVRTLRGEAIYQVYDGVEEKEFLLEYAKMKRIGADRLDPYHPTPMSGSVHQDKEYLFVTNKPRRGGLEIYIKQEGQWHEVTVDEKTTVAELLIDHEWRGDGEHTPCHPQVRCL